VKYSFLLDENLLYHSIKGVDLYGNLDLSSTQLVVLIAQNCHSIRYNPFLLARYRHHLSILKNEKSKILDPVFFERLFFGNSLKAVREDAEPPQLPVNAHIPNEDIDVVRAALISHPKFISNDPELREAINACQQLHLTALTPQDAMQFASQT
jgi:hypothetical protein